MRVNKLIYIITIAVLYLVSCGGDDGDGTSEELETPELQSSIPVDGDTGIAITTTSAELIFAQEILLVSASRIKINDNEVSSANVEGDTLTVTFPSLELATEYTITLEAKAIKVVGGAINSEPISISFTSTGKQDVNVTSGLVVNNPSTEATNLYNFLKENYGSKIISSAMANVNWNTNEAEWVKQHTGKYPAINTFDYVHLRYSPANWIDYSDISVAQDWWDNNGIISAGWHWVVPIAKDSTTYTYKPDETTFEASNALVEGTWENTFIEEDLVEITGYLKLLQEENIPVIWRPLHEAAGNIYEYTDGKAWFWWGTDGAETYKALWKYLFEYFEEQGLNNLIWVWTTETGDSDFYPGDEYVDIIGRDIYNNSNNASIADEFETIQQTYPNKMVTLSECGSVANISDQWQSGAYWSYFMPWYDYDRTNDVDESDFSSTEHEHADADWWTDAFEQDYVITRDEMPSLQ